MMASTLELELPLKTELNLARVEGFYQTPVRVQAVVGTDQNRIGMVGQVVSADTE
jgi:hypothetical protein